MNYGIYFGEKLVAVGRDAMLLSYYLTLPHYKRNNAEMREIDAVTADAFRAEWEPKGFTMN